MRQRPLYTHTHKSSHRTNFRRVQGSKAAGHTGQRLSGSAPTPTLVPSLLGRVGHEHSADKNGVADKERVPLLGVVKNSVAKVGGAAGANGGHVGMGFGTTPWSELEVSTISVIYRCERLQMLRLSAADGATGRAERKISAYVSKSNRQERKGLTGSVVEPSFSLSGSRRRWWRTQRGSQSNIGGLEP